MLALLSWRRKRHRIHTTRPLAALLADLASLAPDHTAVTGDLVNFAMPAEFVAARDWLETLGAKDRVSVVPGNHDLTAAVAWPDGIGQWADWMGDGFPYVKRLGPVALIGLSSAIVTPVGSAAGRLGAAQLARLEAVLAETRAAGLCRVMLIHHPPVIGPGGRRKALRDRDALCAVLRRQGVELVLHGHHHRTRLMALPGPKGPIPVFGVPAALASLPAPELAGWHLHSITANESGWRLRTLARRYQPAENRFRQVGDWTMQLPSAHRQG